MPWKETCHVNERLKFVARLQDGERMKDVCEAFGISRKTGHKLWKRYQERGVEALYDQSRAPRRIPHRTPPETRKLVIDAKKKHPTWGPRRSALGSRPRHREFAFQRPARSAGFSKKRAW